MNNDRQTLMSLVAQFPDRPGLVAYCEERLRPSLKPCTRPAKRKKHCIVRERVRFTTCRG